MSRKVAWPTDEELLRLVEQHGGMTGAARFLGIPGSSMREYMGKRGLAEEAKRRATQAAQPKIEQQSGVKVEGNTVFVTMPASRRLELGDYGVLLRERGLDPDDWTIVAVKANEWDALAAVKRGDEPKTVRMKQWSITFKPAWHKLMPSPAVHVPPVKRTKVGAPASELPELIVVEGDHQVPYHDPRLHEASVAMLKTLAKKHRLTEHVFLGDTGDFPTISRHDDHPAAMAPVNKVIQEVYNLLREKREAAPNARARKLKGNHDWRVDGELLKRAERMYDIRPAQRWEDDATEKPALHLDRLLHLPQLGVEFVEDPRGWQHAEVELVGGTHGLVVRHGWLHNAKTAEASVRKRGRSIIVGHIHRREHVFVWDPSMECERQGVVSGTMSLVRDERYPHYTTLDNWLQGCVIVTRWPDDTFEISHVPWNGQSLRWRDYRWRGAP